MRAVAVTTEGDGLRVEITLSRAELNTRATPELMHSIQTLIEAHRVREFRRQDAAAES